MIMKALRKWDKYNNHCTFFEVLVEAWLKPKKVCQSFDKATIWWLGTFDTNVLVLESLPVIAVRRIMTKNFTGLAVLPHHSSLTPVLCMDLLLLLQGRCLKRYFK